jgi:UDP-N-acetyl-D-galactosamine dehydrogenase
MDIKIAVIGLGYVGLPLAVEFGKKYNVVGFDVNQKRINELKNKIDRTMEVSREDIEDAHYLSYTINVEDIKNCKYYIVTVPTPIDENKKPYLKPLLNATKTVGSVLKKEDIVIYESTVYPGCTEEECVPILENESKLKFNVDFFCGYSPERINPGDKEHTLKKIKKVVSGSTKDALEKINKLYGSIIEAGIHTVSSIKVAEAAKVIENTQRDINIAFINELAVIFNRMGIDTQEVLEAAGTKWNFLGFRPGLVGGHCIGVDPFYLTFKAQQIGYNPEIVLAGRRLNDNMGIFIANRVIKLMIKKGKKIKGANILILGITFKENVPDIRNSKVIDIIKEFKDFGCKIDVFDPIADKEEVKSEYGINLIEKEKIYSDNYEGVVLAVSHNEFKSFDFSFFKKNDSIIYDIKGIIDRFIVDERL